MLGHLAEPSPPNLRVAEVSRLQRAAEAAAKALAAEKAARRDESAAAAAEMAQLTERLSAAEAMKQEVRFSDMSDISWPDVSDPESMESVLGQGRTSYPLAGQATLIKGARRWSEELTLFQPWRSHTLKGLSKDCISHWTESNEAEFRDGMYHSGFKWRVFMMSSLAFSVCLMVLVDSCLTMLGALAFPFLLLFLTSQIAAQRMVDKRRGRQLGQRSLILLCVGFACSCVPMALYGLSGAAPKWNGGTCRFEVADDGHIDPLVCMVLEKDRLETPAYKVSIEEGGRGLQRFPGFSTIRRIQLQRAEQDASGSSRLSRFSNRVSNRVSNRLSSGPRRSTLGPTRSNGASGTNGPMCTASNSTMCPLSNRSLPNIVELDTVHIEVNEEEEEASSPGGLTPIVAVRPYSRPRTRRSTHDLAYGRAQIEAAVCARSSSVPSQRSNPPSDGEE